MKYTVEEIMKKAKLFRGDNLKCLRSLENNSVDSVVTDPPYGLSFMGKKWDHDVPSIEFWKEVYRVLKPGGHVLSFGGTRTYHRMVVNIEGAGFEIRDQIMWIYGSGFPKSHNVGEQIKKKTGNNSFEGTGTSLKPANEPICIARKPISEKTIANNVLKYGTGGLNISESKIGDDKVSTHSSGSGHLGKNGIYGNYKPQSESELREGRFPSNVIIDEVAGQEIGDQKKFFYCPKVSKNERNIGDNENRNIHPTVKPVDLMRYLIKLVTPKNGVVLDPFMGSGSTGVGTLIEDFNFIGMEMDQEYFEIAKQRIENFEEFKELLDSKKKKQSSKKNVIEDSIDQTNLGIWANRGLKIVA
jgi:DNA modification methylase